MSGADTRAASPLESLAQQADTLAAVPLGEGATDLDVAARAGQVEAEPEQGNAELLAGGIALIRDTVTQLAGVQSIQTTLGEAQVQQLSVLWGKVFDRYGIRLSALMGDHAELVMASIVTLTIGKSVLAGYRAEQAAKKAQPAPVQPAPQPAA